MLREGSVPRPSFILPLSIPALASFAIFQFLWVWNDYLVALDARDGKDPGRSMWTAPSSTRICATGAA